MPYLCTESDSCSQVAAVIDRAAVKANGSRGVGAAGSQQASNASKGVPETTAQGPLAPQKP